MAVAWGIIGPGNIAAAFAGGLKDAPGSSLLAIASRNEARLASFGDTHGIATEKRYNSYAELVADEAVDAIYIATPHPWHLEHSVLALRAGKHVLCEKPAGMFASEVETVTEIAKQENRFFMEAFMYRCHPQIHRVAELVRSGAIGKVTYIEANFSFNAPFDADSRLYNHALGGGGILDVGCYPVSFSRLIAGAAVGADYAEPVSVKAVGRLAKTKVDECTRALLMFESGISALCTTAVAENAAGLTRVHGTAGMIELPEPWLPGNGRTQCDATIHITDKSGTRQESFNDLKHHYSFEIDVANQAIESGLLEASSPALNWQESIGNARVLDQWRREVGYVAAGEAVKTNRVTPGVLPKGLPVMPLQQISGVESALSRLVMGCDNQMNIGDGALVWDAFWEAGGNVFDTAHIYGNGLHERVLGQWMASRGVADSAVVVVKGAHSPYCTPRGIGIELEESLSRLKLARAPIYIMHRDNPDVPVGEFVDALDELHQQGQVGVVGGSNWTPERLREARDYAQRHDKVMMSVLNNNLSLAVMQKPVWPGCISSNDVSSLEWLAQEQITHFSWSSQARGYFLDEALRGRLPHSTSPLRCFDSVENQERRTRTTTLAARQGQKYSANDVALAWVLHQAFPSFALIGPRSAGELVSTIKALDINLEASDVSWLNLET